MDLTCLTLILLNTTTPTFANSVDPDQTASDKETIYFKLILILLNKLCDQDLHYLSLVCELNEYIISSNLISGWSEMGVAKLIYSAG